MSKKVDKEDEKREKKDEKAASDQEREEDIHDNVDSGEDLGNNEELKFETEEGSADDESEKIEDKESEKNLYPDGREY